MNQNILLLNGNDELINIRRLFRTPKNEEISSVRASTLAHYWYCAIQSWFIAQGVDTPMNEALKIGTIIHDEITGAREMTSLEIEFRNYLKSKMVTLSTGRGGTGLGNDDNKVFARAWIENGKTVGYITTHGMDGFTVSPNKEVDSFEYKTTNQKYIDHYKLCTALFQKKVESWILEPILIEGGYRFRKMEIVYFNRKRQPLGVKAVTDYSAAAVERDIQRILNCYRDPSKLLPPANWKCINCPSVFKMQCYIQKRR